MNSKYALQSACPYCGKWVEVEGSINKTQHTCPNCGREFWIRQVTDQTHTTSVVPPVVAEMKKRQERVHKNAVNKGFWEEDRNDGECIALIHSELSECLKALRNGNPPSKKAKGFSHAEEELADVIIRCLDFAEAKGWDIDGALEAKHKYNLKRPYKHGKKF